MTVSSRAIPAGRAYLDLGSKAREDRLEVFDQHLRDLRQRNSKKHSFLRRLERADLRGSSGKLCEAEP